VSGAFALGSGAGEGNRTLETSVSERPNAFYSGFCLDSRGGVRALSSQWYRQSFDIFELKFLAESSHSLALSLGLRIPLPLISEVRMPVPSQVSNFGTLQGFFLGGNCIGRYRLVPGST
jgi:hypothetical protein